MVHYVLKCFKKFAIWSECTTNDVVYKSTIFFADVRGFSKIDGNHMVTLNKHGKKS